MKLTVSKLAFLVALIPLIAASSLVELDVRAVNCRQTDVIAAGPYSLSVNTLVKDTKAPSGIVCAQVDSHSGNDIAWSTTRSNKAGTEQTYTNVAVKHGIYRELSGVRSIQSSWSWSQDSQASSVVATVMYHLFISVSFYSANDAIQIRIWLGSHKAVPISSGKPVLVKSLASHEWNLHNGMDSNVNIFTFVPTSGTISTFKGDLHVFLAYLLLNNKFPSTYYLTSVRAGVQASSGYAKIQTSSFSAVING